MERRHRISGREINHVMKAVHLRLSELYQADDLNEEAQQLFRVLWRFNKEKPGAPGYPEFNKEEVEGVLLNTIHLLAKTR
ncbi:MAG: hypothetical protein NWE89_13530 [Candidatus Bathyarchaeota archaeon]|nr:hypothetical protein [Candidatus Bathyarchaeota archaeon]